MTISGLILLKMRNVQTEVLKNINRRTAQSVTSSSKSCRFQDVEKKKKAEPDT
jgi:hypothetical protein